MTIKEALRTKAIDPHDSEILLSHSLKKSRTFLLAHPEKKLAPVQKKRFQGYVSRRKKHEPVAYIIGHKHFYHLTLKVTRSVLIPRPESEHIVETVLEIARRKKQAIVIDVGTGSGAIALALATHLPRTPITATEISSKALSVAKKNARALGLEKRIRFIKADLLPKNWLGSKDAKNVIIAANLPYLPTPVWRETSADVKKYEPRNALDGGKDGLDVYRQLFDRLRDVKKLTLVLEIDPTHKRLLPFVIPEYFSKAKMYFKKDLSKRWRVAIIRT